MALELSQNTPKRMAIHPTPDRRKNPIKGVLKKRYCIISGIVNFKHPPLIVLWIHFLIRRVEQNPCIYYLLALSIFSNNNVFKSYKISDGPRKTIVITLMSA